MSLQQSGEKKKSAAAALASKRLQVGQLKLNIGGAKFATASPPSTTCRPRSAAVNPGSRSCELKLNIGGAKFTTTYSTINNVEGSMLSAMFSGRHALTPDAEGYHFIDRDGTYFRHVLNLLRFSTEFEVDLSPGDLKELERELGYYGLCDAYEEAPSSPYVSSTSPYVMTGCKGMLPGEAKEAAHQWGLHATVTRPQTVGYKW
ncbi:BTB/POZ protein [Ochromonadaceae sp. CCMP2298]|nr:BTB/POZ protein [Ochromonadaceae sp. CCMP2298]